MAALPQPRSLSQKGNKGYNSLGLAHHFRRLTFLTRLCHQARRRRFRNCLRSHIILLGTQRATRSSTPTRSPAFPCSESRLLRCPHGLSSQQIRFPGLEPCRRHLVMAQAPLLYQTDVFPHRHSGYPDGPLLPDLRPWEVLQAQQASLPKVPIGRDM